MNNIYQVDAFATELFGGNPAAVCPLTAWLSDEKMQSIATENNLSETAFIIKDNEDYQIRWFTPGSEVALCGHATLASAFVVFEYLDYKKDSIIFHCKSGILQVRKNADLLEMDFPALPYTKINPATSLLQLFSVNPLEVYESTFDLMLILNSQADVENAQLDLNAIAKLPYRGIILSAPGADVDVYSRCFYPAVAVSEDPVTGSAHCVIVPYWCDRLGKTKIHALQGLKRRGELWCEYNGDRVKLSGHCQLYLKGTIYF